MEDVQKLIQKPGRKQLSPAHNLLHQKFVQYGANAKEWMRKCILLLPEIEKGRIWEKKGFGSIYEYAAKLAGMNRDTVNDALRILKKIEDKPELRHLVEVRGINAVRPIAGIATVETAGFWAEKATSMSKNTLEMFVRELRKDGGIDMKIETLQDRNSRTRTAETAGNPQQQAIENVDDLSLRARAEASSSECLGRPNADGGPAKQSPKVTIGMQLSPEIADQLQKLKGAGDWNALMKELLALRKEKLEQEKPASLATNSRHIPAKIHKHVLFRTNEICSFPGCKKRHEILHHVQRFALENTHDPDRLEPLCKAHERLAHAGLIENEDEPVENWKIRKQPDKTSEKFLVDQMVAKYRRPK